MHFTLCQSQYFAWFLSRRLDAESVDLLASTLFPSGVTQATGWQAGGGFRYYELAPTLLATDRWGNLVINPEYDPAMLSAAMCKLEGSTYAPSEVTWWQQGRSSETDFIYVTTQTLGAEQLEALSDEVGTDPNNRRSLLVCCGAYRGVTSAQAAQRWPNLTIKKIPKMIKDRCHWGHDDYSLNVINLPMAEIEKTEAAATVDSSKKIKNKNKNAALANAGQGGLFGENE